MSANGKRSEQAEAFVACRTLRHAWEPIGAGDRIPQFGSLVCLRCIRCSTLRYDRFSRLTGERISTPQYVYPDGYRGERHSMAWWRATWAEHIYDLGLTVDAP